MTADPAGISNELAIPQAHEVGLTGANARVYNAQLMVVQTLGKPEYFVDMSLQILGQADLALTEVKPEQRRAIQVQCQQVICHHTRLGRIYLDYLDSKNRQRFDEEIAPFMARVANDMVAAVAESGSNSAERVAQGDVLAVKQAVPRAVAASLSAFASRMKYEGVGPILMLINFCSDASRNATERRRWLLSIETLLEALASRGTEMGPAPSVADIGRRYGNDIVAIYSTEWDAKRFKMREVISKGGFAAMGCGFLALIVLVKVVLIALGILAIVWCVHLVMGQETVPTAPETVHESYLPLFYWMGGTIITLPLGWLGLTELRRALLIASTRRRLRRLIRAIEVGKPARGFW